MKIIYITLVALLVISNIFAEGKSPKYTVVKFEALGNINVATDANYPTTNYCDGKLDTYWMTQQSTWTDLSNKYVWLGFTPQYIDEIAVCREDIGHAFEGVWYPKLEIYTNEKFHVNEESRIYRMVL